MNVCDRNEMRALLAKHGFHFSKAKGQNFLAAAWVPEQIAVEAGVGPDCGVVEIGPGIGSLTQQLCRHAGKVVAIEVDRSLQPVLAETMAGYENLELLWQDALKTDLAALVMEKFPGLQPMACANLPYYITSPVLVCLLEAKCFSTVTVMVQKEVALRICAAPGTANYSAFTIFCNYYAQPATLFDVPPSCFVPQPKVTSTVLQLTCRTAPPCTLLDEALFFRVVKASFAQRRKMLVNGLCAAFPGYSKAEMAGVLEACGFAPTIRGETLSLDSFAALANELARRAQT